VDFATAASQNRFCTYQLSRHKKTNIFQKMTNVRFFLTFIFMNDKNVKFLIIFIFMQTPFCDVAVAKSIGYIDTKNEPSRAAQRLS
jgi:hypothetical protein